MRRIIIPVLASVLALAIPAAAQAWPGPVPGQPACIPQGDGTFVIVPNAQPPFTRGAHQPENGKCEGPVVPVPTPDPAPPQIIIREITHEVIREVPVEKVCTSRRVMRFKVRRFYPGVANHQGSRITRVVRAETENIGTLPDGSSRTTVMRRNGRWVVRVDFRGVQFTGFDNSTRTTVVVRTRRGDRRLIYRADQCRARQGHPNDANARDPEIPVRRGSVR